MMTLHENQKYPNQRDCLITFALVLQKDID